MRQSKKEFRYNEDEVEIYRTERIKLFQSYDPNCFPVKIGRCYRVEDHVRVFLEFDREAKVVPVADRGGFEI